MRPSLYEIERERPGSLSTMAHPQGGARLQDEIRGLATTGVTTLVSLLTQGEEMELGLRGESAAAAAWGIGYLALPTPDRAIPQLAPLLDPATELCARLEAGQHVVAHCWQGIGRSSLLAGAVLVREGVDPAEAWKRIARARGIAVPDTDEQRQFLLTLPR